VKTGEFSIAGRDAGNACSLFPIYRRLPKLDVAVAALGQVLEGVKQTV
jgi:hypothetical protein